MLRCLSCEYEFKKTTSKCPKCSFKPTEINGIEHFAISLSSDSGYKDDFFHEFLELERESFWFLHRNKVISQAINLFCRKKGNYLEIGCGTGMVLEMVAQDFPQYNVVASELSSSGLACAIARIPSAQFIQMDARNIPYANEFDIIGIYDVLEHISEDIEVLANIYKALKPGGILLITVPQHQFLWDSADVFACHKRRYSSKDLITKLNLSGFEILKSTSFVTILFPLMLISRLLFPRREKSDILKEHKTNPFTRAVLNIAMKIELQLLGFGLAFPFGGSLLVVAKKKER